MCTVNTMACYFINLIIDLFACRAHNLRQDHFIGNFADDDAAVACYYAT